MTKITIKPQFPTRTHIHSDEGLQSKTSVFNILFSLYTFRIFVIAGQVFSLIATNGFCTDILSNAFFTDTQYFKMAILVYFPVNAVSINLAKHKFRVVRKVNIAFLDGFNWTRTAAKHAYNEAHWIKEKSQSQTTSYAENNTVNKKL